MSRVASKMHSPGIRTADRVRCAIVAGLVTASSVAQAQTGGAPAPASPAAELFQQGRDAMKRDDYAGACEKFEESEHLTPAPGTLLNLAVCSEKLGRLATALESLRAARDLLPATDSRVDFVKQQIGALEPRVPSITIQLAEQKPGATVSIDGDDVPPQKLAAPIELNPGRHVVALSSPGHEIAKYPVTLQEGRSDVLVLHPGAATAPRASTSPRPSGSGDSPVAREPGDDAHTTAPPTSGGSTKRTAGYVALGAGGLGLVVGTVTGILVLNKKSTMNSHCDSSFACDSTGLDAASSGKTFSTISTVSFVVAAAGVGVGAYLLLTDDGNGGGAAVGIVPNRRGADFSLRGRF